MGSSQSKVDVVPLEKKFVSDQDILNSPEQYMESKQKQLEADLQSSLSQTGESSNDDNSTKISYHKVKSKQEENLQGMALVHHVCRKRKKIYDKCVSNWFSNEFITGKSLHQEEVCGDKFDLYRKCLLKGIKKEVWEKQYNLPPPADNSPLAEVDDDE